MQQASEDRKAKLAALRKRKAGQADPDPSPGQGEPGARPEVFKFRNYDPETGTMRKHQKLDEEDTVEKQVEGLAEQVIAEDEARRAEELDLTNIQPKKPNWDLKRDLDRKLAKLKGKTDMAISQLIRKRLQAEKGGEAAAASLVAGFQSSGTRQGEEEADLSDPEDDD